MLYNKLYAFTSLNGGSTASEDIATDGTTENVSVALEIQAADLGDGKYGSPYLYISCKDNTDLAGSSAYIRFKLTDCASSGGTYYAVACKEKLITEITDGAMMYKIRLPEDIKKFLKLSIQGVSVTSGKIGVFNAAIVTG